MAFFAVTPNLEGKTLRQIRKESSDPWRSDLIASAMGINEDTPLKAGMSAEINLDANSAEYKFFQKAFRETTREALYAEQQVKALQEQITKETQWVDKYLKDNPFVFDEQLAKQSVTAEYKPYYTELLQDYLTDVNLKRETTQDQQKLLRNLRQLDIGEKTRSYEYAVENAESGWEGKGLFSSGMRVRDIGKKNIEYKTGMEEASARYQTGEAGLTRELTGYDLAEEQRRRDLFGGQEEVGGLAKYGTREGEYQKTVGDAIEQRRSEAMKPYLANYEQTYKRQFQPGSMSALDYLPPDYLRF